MSSSHKTDKIRLKLVLKSSIGEIFMSHWAQIVTMLQHFALKGLRGFPTQLKCTTLVHKLKVQDV